jgi:hypothetical protein
MRKLLAGTLALLIVVPSALAGPPSKFPVDVDAATQKGEWSDNGLVRRNVGQRFESFYWRVQSRDDRRRAVTLTDLKAPDGSDYRVRWFRGSNEITSRVVGAGYEFDLPPEARRGTAVFEAQIKAKVPNPDPVCLIAYFALEGEEPGPYSYGVYVNDGGVCG